MPTRRRAWGNAPCEKGTQGSHGFSPTGKRGIAAGSGGPARAGTRSISWKGPAPRPKPSREQARHDAAGLLEQAEEDLARELAQRREEAKAAREREREDLLAQARRKAAADRTRPAWHDAVIDEIAALVIPQLPEAGDA